MVAKTCPDCGGTLGGGPPLGCSRASACQTCGGQPAERPSVYQALKAAGVPLDSHESDLYAKVTPESARILREYGLLGRTLCSTFTSQIDGARWYDLPFKFDPWWERRRTRAGAEKA